MRAYSKRNRRPKRDDIYLYENDVNSANDRVTVPIKRPKSNQQKQQGKKHTTVANIEEIINNAITEPSKAFTLPFFDDQRTLAHKLMEMMVIYNANKFQKCILSRVVQGDWSQVVKTWDLGPVTVNEYTNWLGTSGKIDTHTEKTPARDGNERGFKRCAVIWHKFVGDEVGHIPFFTTEWHQFEYIEKHPKSKYRRLKFQVTEIIFKQNITLEYMDCSFKYTIDAWDDEFENWCPV
jgi:hypothetical protein